MNCIIMSQQSDHEIGHIKTTLTVFSCFSVYPCSFTIKNVDTGDNVKARIGLGLAFATRFPVPLFSTLVRGISSDVPVTYLLIPSIHHANPRNCSVSKQRFDHDPHRNVLDDNRLSHPALGRSSCFHESTLTRDDSSLPPFNASCLQQFSHILHQFCWRGFRTIYSPIQAMETTNVLAWIFEHTQQLWEHPQHNFLCFLVFHQSMSLYIDIKMILPLKCSGSRF